MSDRLIRIVAADDEPLALRRLASALRELPDVELIATAADGREAARLLGEHRPDLALLDIAMPGLDGLKVAAGLEPDGGIKVAFLTAYDSFAAAAFAVEAVDYLMKPIRPERLAQAIERVRRRRREQHAAARLPVPVDDEPALHLPDRDGGRDLAQSEILWIEAAKDYALIHTATRTHILRTTMAELAARLRPSIIRVHRSAFVAVEAIERRMRLQKGLLNLLLIDGTQLQVGPSYLAAVRRILRAERPELF